jgi:hypothetical protein
MAFKNKDALKTYLKITKDVLVPSLKSQINTNFKWAAIIDPLDVDFVKNYLDIDFLSFNNFQDFFEYSKLNNINIQTRHDMDDYMSPEYVDAIHKEFEININKYDKFLIQSQPVQLMYHNKEEFKMGLYTNTRNSMFLSLCQKDVTNHIFERKHGQMYEITNNVISLPEGYTKWVIHGNNISVLKNNGLPGDWNSNSNV